MAAGCFEEAIPLYAAFAHWRKVGDALFALGRIDEAKVEYEKGPNEAGETIRHSAMVPIAIA